MQYLPLLLVALMLSLLGGSETLAQQGLAAGRAAAGAL